MRFLLRFLGTVAAVVLTVETEPWAERRRSGELPLSFLARVERLRGRYEFLGRAGRLFVYVKKGSKRSGPGPTGAVP